MSIEEKNSKNSKKKDKDIQPIVDGNPNLFKTLYYYNIDSKPNYCEHVKVMNIYGGCIMISRTFVENENKITSVSESSTFIPGSHICHRNSDSPRLIKIENDNEDCCK